MGTYIRLVDYGSQQEKENAFLGAIENKNISKIKFNPSSNNFSKIPGSPIAYWVNSSLLKSYTEAPALSNISEPKQGLKTGDNDTFLRMWHEIILPKFSIFNSGNSKWFPCNKGGEYRKWYGNNDYVINWENDGYKLKNFRHPDGRLKSRPQNLQYMKKEGLTYTNISSGNLAVRYSPKGFLFDAAGSMIFTDKERLLFLLAFMGCKVATLFTTITSPTMSFEVGQLSTIPVRIVRNMIIDDLSQQSLEISKTDWDSFETSWDFKKNPLV